MDNEIFDLIGMDKINSGRNDALNDFYDRTDDFDVYDMDDSYCQSYAFQMLRSWLVYLSAITNPAKFAKILAKLQ